MTTTIEQQKAADNYAEALGMCGLARLTGCPELIPEILAIYNVPVEQIEAAPQFHGPGKLWSDWYGERLDGDLAPSEPHSDAES